jgi:GNAT superfamily N-acetyltransferase
MSYATLFGITDLDAAHYLKLIFEEEVSGCELSVDSYLVAEINGVVAATVAGWKEAIGNLPSAILKGNLINYVFPVKQVAHLTKYRKVLSEILMPREAGTAQLEYLYVADNFRRMGLGSKIMRQLLENFKQDKTLKRAQTQLFYNEQSLALDLKIGFKIVQEKIAASEIIKSLLPSNRKFLLEIDLNE